VSTVSHFSATRLDRVAQAQERQTSFEGLKLEYEMAKDIEDVEERKEELSRLRSVIKQFNST
jgi:adenine C2-methylase RlmN of 23S rRNA A2503 and tRNA A37